VTNSSTPSAPSSPFSTSPKRGYLIRVEYPVLDVPRYGIFTREKGWHTTAREQAPVWGVRAMAQEGADVLNEELRDLGARANIENVDLPDADEPDEERRGFRIRLEYTGCFEYRYAIRKDTGWGTTTQSEAQVFSDVVSAQEAFSGFEKELEGLGVKIMFEPVSDFEPDWCIAPGEHIREQLKELDITEPQLAARLGLSRFAVRELIEGRIGITRSLAQELARALSTSVEYWENLDRNYREGLRMGRTKT
jgi:addiction module HigA family antidote